jgi:predicted nucleic acid-binding protein
VNGVLKHEDSFIVVHITNSEKEYLPFEWKPEYLFQYYDALITEYGSRASVLFEEKDKNLTTKEHL